MFGIDNQLYITMQINCFLKWYKLLRKIAFNIRLYFFKNQLLHMYF